MWLFSEHSPVCLRLANNEVPRPQCIVPSSVSYCAEMDSASLLPDPLFPLTRFCCQIVYTKPWLMRPAWQCLGEPKHFPTQVNAWCVVSAQKRSLSKRTNESMGSLVVSSFYLITKWAREREYVCLWPKWETREQRRDTRNRSLIIWPLSFKHFYRFYWVEI